MVVHLVKLCVGVPSVEQLEASLAREMAARREAGEPELAVHVTRMSPSRREEIENGGSLYWVIKGQVSARQKLLEVRTVKGEDGIGRCQLVLGPEVIETAPMPKRPFQGWRYLLDNEIPKDLGGLGDDVTQLPEELRRHLAELGLL